MKNNPFDTLRSIVIIDEAQQSFRKTITKTGARIAKCLGFVIKGIGIKDTKYFGIYRLFLIPASLEFKQAFIDSKITDSTWSQ